MHSKKSSKRIHKRENCGTELENTAYYEQNGVINISNQLQNHIIKFFNSMKKKKYICLHSIIHINFSFLFIVQTRAILILIIFEKNLCLNITLLWSSNSNGTQHKTFAKEKETKRTDLHKVIKHSIGTNS